MTKYVHIAVPLVDIFPESKGAAAVAVSVVRCAMAAAGIAILQPLMDAEEDGILWI
jgi:hypothetical protein